MTATEQFKTDLIGLADFAYNRLRSRLDDMTDDEYFWEPAPGCWSIRLDADGKLRRDGAPVPVKPAPLTTIAWRLTHVIDMLAGERNATWIGAVPSGTLELDGEAGSASEAIEQLERAYALFRGHVGSAEADKLELPMGAIAGPYSDDTRAAFVLHELDELIHHGAEIAALRDLFRATRPVPPLVDACLRGDLQAVDALVAAEPSLVGAHSGLIAQLASASMWNTVRHLVELGFDVNGGAGVSALHYATAGGDLDVVEMLVDRGADVTARDTEFGKTPAEWAEYRGHHAIALRLADAQ